MNQLSLLNKKVVVTAGGTIEEIDPVRYISNYSSGKMGIAIADEAHRQGAEVVLITTTLTTCTKWEREEFLNEQGEFRNPGEGFKTIKVIKVKSAKEMQTALEEEFNDSDYIIMAAAVADYRVKNISEQKIKKTNNDELTIELVKNPDILKSLCEKKNKQIIVGFCAETNNLIENAKSKLQRKGCDYLVANDVSRKDIGFSSDYNEVIIFDQNLDMKILKKAEKNLIAQQILEVICG